MHDLTLVPQGVADSLKRGDSAERLAATLALCVHELPYVVAGAGLCGGQLEIVVMKGLDLVRFLCNL